MAKRSRVVEEEELSFADILGRISKERGISINILVDAIEAALVSAYKKSIERPNLADGQIRRNAANCRARASLDLETGKSRIWVSKTVSETVEDSVTQISLEDARKINRLLELGDVVEEEADTSNFGRIAAQTAKGVIMQRIREAERGAIYEEYQEKESEALTAIVQRVDKNGDVYVEIGRSAGLIPANEVIVGETYEPGDKLKVYVLKVHKENKGPQIIASRTHPELIKKLFELEIPEIQTGVVRVVSVAREAGQRTKIAVMSNDPSIDAVGACVGQRGTRWNASLTSFIMRRWTSLSGIPISLSILRRRLDLLRCSWYISTKRKRRRRSSFPTISFPWLSARKARTQGLPPSSQAGRSISSHSPRLRPTAISIRRKL